MEDEALLQRLGVTAARAEDVERHVIAAHAENGRESIIKQLNLLQQEIDAVRDGLEHLGQAEPDDEALHSTLANDRLQSLKSKKKRLRAELRRLARDGQSVASSSNQQQPPSLLYEDNDFDAALDAAWGIAETERERLIRTGALTPFHKIKGFERRVQFLEDQEREQLEKLSVSNAVTSLAAISRSRASTKLLDATELPKLEGPTREFRRPRKVLAAENGAKRKKRKRPLPDLEWRWRHSQDSSDESAGGDAKRQRGGDENDVLLEGGLRIPLNIYSKLFDYQKTGVKWLWELHSLRTGGIIGDEMGLGKTIQVISFLAALHHSGMYKPSIVVCPLTLVFQWKKEVEKWYPKFKVQVVHPKWQNGNGEAKVSDETDDEEEDTKSDTFRWDQMIKKAIESESCLVVTTYEQLRLLRDKLLGVEWGYAILDEGHKIRNPDSETTLICKQLRTVNRIIMTGSPIQNKLTELWSLFDFVFPGKLGVLPVFQAQFAVPINIGGYANATPLQVSTAYKCALLLRDLIMPYLLRRMKSDVEAKLTKKTEHVLFCRLTDVQREVYRAFLASSEVESILHGSRNALYGIDIMRKICNHPDLLEKDSSENHPDYGSLERSGKLMVVSQVLKLWKEQGHRVLIFCQTQQMLDILENFVVSQQYTYRRMDGSTPVKQRTALIDEFNESSQVFMFLLTTKVGGLGTNLTGANRVIIFDPDWNPSTDVQARERAWRIGQTKDVTVYRLITRGSIEEKVYHRQIYKQFLSNRVLRDPQQKRIFKCKDLRDLFVLQEEEEGEKTETSNLFTEFFSEAKRAENAVKPDEESGLLKSLMEANGIHSAMDHDAILAANNPERLKVDLEASKVAEQAAEALQQSRLSRMRDGVAVPTWTGNSGAAGAPGGGRKRFGGAINSRLVSSGEFRTGGVLSSRELLSQMKERQAGTSDAVESNRNQWLCNELRSFLRQNGGSASTTTLIQHFKGKISQSEAPLFKQLLNEIATLNKGDQRPRWFLKPNR